MTHLVLCTMKNSRVLLRVLLRLVSTLSAGAVTAALFPGALGGDTRALLGLNLAVRLLACGNKSMELSVASVVDEAWASVAGVVRSDAMAKGGALVADGVDAIWRSVDVACDRTLCIDR